MTHVHDGGHDRLMTASDLTASGPLCRVVFGAALLIATAMPLGAQQHQMVPPETPAAEPQQAPPEAPPARRPGLIDALGDLFDKSGDMLSLKGAQQAIGDLNRKAGEATRDAAKSAADGLTRIPVGRMASGRTLCVVASNGAPDCVTAANALCKSQGYSGGSSVATESGERCPARVYLTGRPPKPGECKMETFVTSAMCQ
jgi:hypothetical protein